MNWARHVTLASMVLLHIACSASEGAGNADAGFPRSPYVSLVSDSGKLRIEIRTAPDQPPTRGTSSVEMRVVEVATETPVDGIAFTVVPWMPAHGHGSSVKPTVTAAGGGRYVLTNVDLFMPGRWELRTTFSGGANDSAAPAFDVQ